MYKGYEVINGDLTDYRPLDGKGVIVGLRYKKLANNEINYQMMNSCFVVNANSEECTPVNVQELIAA